MASSSAASNSNEQSRELCRYFLSNACRFGEKCFYSHDRSSIPTANNVCRFYLRGKCNYGDQCRFDHVRPKPQSSVRISTDNKAQSFTTNSHPSRFAQAQQQYPSPMTLQSFCPYVEKDGHCEARETGRYCPYIHGDHCDLCEKAVLHPTNKKQREEHRAECLKKSQANREEALAIERSRDKKCGICLETVWDRDGDKRFGMLENCEHIFCLECIRTWRSSSNYEHKVVKACPECRTKSDFITPTKYWPDNDQTKKNLMKSYKDNLQKIHCKFFKRGTGVCPFGSKCFYLHMDKNGRRVELGPPRRRRRFSARGELESLADVFLLSLLSPIDVGRFFDEFDFLFDDDNDEIESYGSYLTDDEDFRFPFDHNLTDNDDDDEDDDETYDAWR